MVVSAYRMGSHGFTPTELPAAVSAPPQTGIPGLFSKQAFASAPALWAVALTYRPPIETIHVRGGRARPSVVFYSQFTSARVPWMEG